MALGREMGDRMQAFPFKQPFDQLMAALTQRAAS